MSQDREIEEYIRENRDTYTRKAITKKLLAMGHQQNDIHRIWATLESETPPRHSENSLGYGVSALWVIGLLFGLFYLYLSASFHFESGFYIDSAAVPRYVGFNVLFIATEIGGLVAVVLLRRRGLSPSQLGAFLVALNFVWFIVILGTCLKGGFLG